MEISDMAQSAREEYQKWLNKPGNREKKNAQKREWNRLNRERIKEYKKEYKTPEVKAREYAAHIEWKKKNPDRLKTYNKRSVERLNNDPAALKRKEIRGRLYTTIKSKCKVSKSLESLVGCSKQQLKEQLQSSFKEGMTWENYGSYWQIDHVKPLILFDVLDPEEYLKSTHHSNLQPLLSVENLRKGTKYEPKAA
jgi:hypothetical protein